MCLICSKKAKIRRANKERICYKVLRKDGDQLRAPYFGTTYEVGSVVCSNKPLEMSPKTSQGSQKVDEGLYAFQNPEDAVWCLACINLAAYEMCCVIAECKIPVGAYYVQGKMLGGEKAYVSDKLIVEKLI